MYDDRGMDSGDGWWQKWWGMMTDFDGLKEDGWKKCMEGMIMMDMDRYSLKDGRYIYFWYLRNSIDEDWWWMDMDGWWRITTEWMDMDDGG